MLAIFDLDGVVVDSMPALTELAVEVISTKYGRSKTEARAMYDRTVGAPFEAQLDRLFPNQQHDNALARAAYETKHFHLAPTFAVAPRMSSTMRVLQFQEWYTALITSTRFEILRNMPQLQPLGFHYIQGYCPCCRNEKIAQIRYALDRFQVAPSHAVFFGDSIADELYAKEAGVRFVQSDIATIHDHVVEAL